MQTTYASRPSSADTRSFRTVAIWLSVWVGVLFLLARV
jgi:hypothetical protein